MRSEQVIAREALLAAVLDGVVAGDLTVAEGSAAAALGADPVWAGALHAFTLFMHRRFGEAAQAAGAALSAADTADPLGRSLAVATHALCLAGVDGSRPPDRLGALEEDLPAGPGAAGFIRYLAAEAALACARVDLAATVVDRSGPPGVTHPYATVEAVMRVRVLAFSGRISEATELLTHVPAAQPPLLALLVEATETLVLGNAAERTQVRALADRIEARHAASVSYISSGCYLLIAFGLVAVGDVRRAARLALHGGGDADLSGYTTVDRALAFELLVAAAAQDDDLDAAESWASRAAVLKGSMIAGSTIDRLGSRVALLRGHAGEALRLAERAVHTALAEGRVVEAAEGEIVAARARIATGHPGDAGTRLEAVVGQADERGHGAVRRAAARELRPRGRRLRPAHGSRWDGLSERERDVAVKVAAGLSNREIAAALHVSEHTVRAHVSRVLAAFGVASRSGIVAGIAEFLPTEQVSLTQLTPRQRAVAARIAEGASNVEIASLLGVSVKTVEMHVGEILRRSGLHSRVDIARAARSLPE